jgi:1-acyl-sn-glycerol-3-phosphate acyltransferase
VTGFLNEARLLFSGRDWRGRSRIPRSAQPHVLPPEPTDFPTAWARTAAARVARRGLQRGVLTPLTWSQTRPEVQGREYLDGLEGPVIVVANHASHLDAPLILGSLPRALSRRLAVGAAADYFFDARWRAAMSALIFNAFPVERYGSRRRSSVAPQLLDDGYSLLLFPEGTRSEDGWMSQLRLGAAQLCVMKGVPAVPVVLRGTFAAMPRGRNWPMPGRPRIVVRYGKPLIPAEAEGARSFQDRMIATVSRLWAEEELGWYRSLRASAGGELGIPVGPQAAQWRRIWQSTRPLPNPRTPAVWQHNE